MTKLGRYCKAYTLTQLRDFPGWVENTENFREESETNSDTNADGTSASTEVIVYLQEDHTVTHGTYLDENVIFDNVTEEWKNFCENSLEFCIPDYVNDEVMDQTKSGEE